MLDSATYDSYLVPAVFEPWSRELIRRAQVWKGDQVLDVVTRSGILACRIAGTGATVTAIDADADLLARARQRASDEGVGVRWIEGPPDALPIRQPSFDLVTCQQGLQLAAEPAAATHELRRVTNPGGRVVVSCWAPAPRQLALGPLAQVAQQRLGVPLDTGLWSGALGDEAGLQTLLVAASFFAVAVETVTRQVRVPEPERFVRATFAAHTDDAAAVDAAVPEGLAAVASFAQDGDLVFPMVSVIAVGRVRA